MRTETSLSILAILMAFLSGVLVLTVMHHTPVELTPFLIRQELNAFEKTNLPKSLLNMAVVYPFIDPQGQLPSYHLFPYADVTALKRYETCTGPKPLFSDTSLIKAAEWQEAVCSKKPLRDLFLETRPYFHPSGKSYAFLEGKRHGFSQTHIKHLHVLELAQTGLKLDPPYSYLSTLGWQDLYRLYQEEKLIVGNQSVFVKHDLLHDVYNVYDRGPWDAFWSRSDITPHSSGYEGPCYLKEHGVCWEQASPGFLNRKNAFTALMVISVLLTLILLWLLFGRVRRRQADEKRLTFALEMLAHEMRTPVTNIMLHLENFRTDFDSQTGENQTSLLRLFDQVERLKRLVSTSQNYLSKSASKDVIAVNKVEVSSLHAFIEHTLDPYRDQISLELDDRDIKTALDPYWTSICIKNVVENAVKHGTPPVKVKVTCHASAWSIETTDQGMEEFSTSKKGPHSLGLGLGFKLVQQIMSQLEGTMAIKFRPTHITLTFKRFT